MRNEKFRKITIFISHQYPLMQNPNYSKRTLEELKAEEKKLKRNEVLSAGLIGFSVGIIIYGIAKGGFGFIYIAIPLGLIYLVYRNSKKTKDALKKLQAEISNKRSD